MHRRITNRPGRRGERRGSATVELAVALPFLFTLLFGVIEIGRALEVAYILQTAVREGARFGATDKEGFIPDGMSANTKIVQDVRNYLVASGIPGSSLSVECVNVPDDPQTPATTFNFEDSNNHMKPFRINATVPFSAVTYCPPPLQKFFTPSQSVTASAIFQNYHK